MSILIHSLVEICPTFQGFDGISVEKHLEVFDRFVDSFNVEREDILMRLFLMSLQCDV
jgi:hypothetical protein